MLRPQPLPAPRPIGNDTARATRDCWSRWDGWVDAKLRAHAQEQQRLMAEAVGRFASQWVGKKLKAENAKLRRELNALHEQIKELQRERSYKPPTIIGWKLDRKKFRIVPFYDNGQPGPPINARILFEQYDEEVSCRV